MARLFKTIGARKTRLRRAGKPLHCSSGLGCCNVDIPCDPLTAILNTCSDLDCLGGMFAVVNFEIVNGSNVDPPCDWSELGGAYLLPMGPGCATEGISGASSFRRLSSTNCGVGGCPEVISAGFSVTCVNIEGADYLQIEANLSAATTDDMSCNMGNLSAGGLFALPVTIPDTFTLTPASPDQDYGVLVSCTVTFYGAPCQCPDGCLLPPIAGATLERVSYYDPDFTVDSCGFAPEIEEQFFVNSCRLNVTDTSTAGGCPVDRVWVSWDGGFEEIEPGGTIEIDVNDACGEFEGDLTIIAMDSRGCFDTTVIPFSCCGCCAPEGDGISSFDPDDNVDGISPGVNCDEPSSEATDTNCFLHDHRLCYYKFTFGSIDVGECSDGGFHFVDWDGVEARGGGSLPTCVFPGDEVRVRVDEGMLGPCHCIKVTPVNYEGCVGDAAYYELNGPMCVSTIEYEGADPENDCYPYLLISDCPPLE